MTNAEPRSASAPVADDEATLKNTDVLADWRPSVDDLCRIIGSLTYEHIAVLSQYEVSRTGRAAIRRCYAASPDRRVPNYVRDEEQIRDHLNRRLRELRLPEYGMPWDLTNWLIHDTLHVLCWGDEMTADERAGLLTPAAIVAGLVSRTEQETASVA